MPQPLSAPKLCQIVADHFRGQIIRGELSDGDHFPTEAPLIDALRVSRPTLREAMRILESEQLISVARGTRTGARVRRPTLTHAARQFGLLMQANRVTMGEIAAARRTLEQNMSGNRALTMLDQMLALVAEAQPRHARRNAAPVDVLGGLQPGFTESAATSP